MNTKLLKLSRYILLVSFVISINSCTTENNKNQLEELVNRLIPTHVGNFIFEEIATNDSIDYFELESKRNKIIIRGSNPSSMGAGLNWYLKYYCNSHISWNSKNLNLPENLPVVEGIVRKETSLLKRYYLNYCTYSYSMAWWDWERWEKEIDWMVLHGINMPLLIVGEEAVWQNTLKRLNYTDKEIKEFISGPGFFAWLLMSNLESWGGPLPQSWIDSHVDLRKKIQQRMGEFGMEPVFQGFSGMVPNSLKEKYSEANIHDPGLWCNFRRPAFLVPTDSLFDIISSIYYDEQEKLYGVASSYQADPFHEGGNTEGVNLKAAGEKILQAMKNVNSSATWSLQSWQGIPKMEMLDNLPKGDIVIVDLFGEGNPQWGNPFGESNRKPAEFVKHNWIWSMVHNFGGNVGLYGNIDRVITSFYESKKHRSGKNLVGMAATPEGIENNPVMYELIFEFPWREESFDVNEWIKTYSQYRYGKKNVQMEQAWQILRNTVYNCKIVQQGTTESLLCARPALILKGVSTWGSSRLYYNPDMLSKAWTLMLDEVDEFREVDTYQYDLVDVTRQVIANKANVLHKQLVNSYRNKDLRNFKKQSSLFLELILDQDRLLSTRKEFLLGTWLKDAKSHGNTQQEKALYEWNARVQITTWGPRKSSEDAGLHEYSHREWAGLLKGFYYPRWKMFFDKLEIELNGEKTQGIDFYEWEEEWTKKQNIYSSEPVGNSVDIATELHEKYK